MVSGVKYINCEPLLKPGGLSPEMHQIWCLFGARRDICRDTDPLEKLKGTKRVPKRGLGGSARLPGEKTTIFWRPKKSNLGKQVITFGRPKNGSSFEGLPEGGLGSGNMDSVQDGSQKSRSPRSPKSLPKRSLFGTLPGAKS